jgi:hypothetical protein
MQNPMQMQVQNPVQRKPMQQKPMQKEHPRRKQRTRRTFFADSNLSRVESR